MNRLLPPLLALSLWAVSARAQTLPASGVLLDSYAAIVNGKAVTVGDVLAVLGPAQERLSSRYSGSELEQKLIEEYDAARANLVESELILLDFEMQGGTLPDRAVEDHVNSVIHERFSNDRAAFLRALAAERLTFTEWRKQMKDQLIVQIMRQKEVSAKILITPLDLQNAYDRKRDAYALPERVRIRTVALPATTTATDAADIHDRIRSGKTTLEQIAEKGATLQDDPGFIDLASLNETIRRAIADLAPGDIAGPIDIDGAFYLVQLAERQEARVRPFDEAAPEIEKELRRVEFDRLNKIWLDSLRSKYYVQIFTHDLFN